MFIILVLSFVPWPNFDIYLTRYADAASCASTWDDFDVYGDACDCLRWNFEWTITARDLGGRQVMDALPDLSRGAYAQTYVVYMSCLLTCLGLHQGGETQSLTLSFCLSVYTSRAINTNPKPRATVHAQLPPHHDAMHDQNDPTNGTFGWDHEYARCMVLHSEMKPALLGRHTRPPPLPAHHQPPALRLFQTNLNLASPSTSPPRADTCPPSHLTCDLIDDDQDVNVFKERIGGRAVPGLPRFDPNRTVSRRLLVPLCASRDAPR